MKGDPIPLSCRCGRDAEVQVGILESGLVIAVVGMGVVFDPPGMKPPENFMPTIIECRRCRRQYGPMEPRAEERQRIPSGPPPS